ncbi:siderophore-interacting protein [Nitriliruptoraceae bacterium ZYF776]|nr:siderophore-interacting protein [Profundirhabdus halotolerans]
MFGTVVAVERPTPSLVRVVLAGQGLAGFATPQGTDAYVNVAFPPAGAPYAAPFDLDEVRELPRELQPHRRRYTVRRFDPVDGHLTLELVVHGDAGVGGAWARRVRLGDALVLQGPSGTYRPDPDADWHLFAGDESALPAIAASLEAVPAGVPAVARIVVDGPAHEVPLASPGALDLRWLHRGTATDPSRLLADAVRDLVVPPGRCHAFVHGEAGEIREVRRHLLGERGLARTDLSCSPYWRRGHDDESWRQVKRAFLAEVERDVA